MPTARIGVTSTPVFHDQHHLHSLNRAFVDAVVLAGGTPLVIPVLDPSSATEVLDGLDGLLLSGGGDVDPSFYGEDPSPELEHVHPERDAFEIALVHAAIASRVPLLGVCRGHQVLNVAMGGRLHQHVPHLTGVNHQDKVRAGDLIHAVQVEPGSLVAEVLGAERVGVNTLHHQAVAEPGRELRVVASSTDDGLIEAVEHPNRSIIGVQWHPELLQRHDEQRRLFRWLVDAGATRRCAGVDRDGSGRAAP